MGIGHRHHPVLSRPPDHTGCDALNSWSVFLGFGGVVLRKEREAQGAGLSLVKLVEKEERCCSGVVVVVMVRSDRAGLHHSGGACIHDQ